MPVTERGLPSLLDKLLTRLQEREDLEWEFKGARYSIPKDLWPTVSAFANTSGGWIVLGIQEHQGRFVTTGIDNYSAMLQDLHNQLRNPQKVSYATCGAADVSVERVGGKHVIVIRVPSAPRTSRPVYVNNKRDTETYIRRDSGDYRCTQQEVERMIREAGTASIDMTILPLSTIDELDHAAVARYRQRHQTQNPASPLNGYNDERFLHALSAYRQDRSTGQIGLTVAGILMFGTPNTIQEIRSRHLIDYRLLSPSSGIDRRWEDRIHHDGNLFTAFEAIYPKLTADLPTGFTLVGATRVDETVAHTALREALINLLAHADYTETQASLIEQSPNRYLFRNPGDSRVREPDLYVGNRSDPRNPRIIDMFRRIGLAEEAGTGIPKIIGDWHRAGFERPEIDVGTERYEFSIQLRPVHLISDSDLAWLQQLGNTWSEAEQMALVTARQEGNVDNPHLRRRTGLLLADATMVLVRLRDRGLLEMVGRKRTASYRLSQKARVGLTPELRSQMESPDDFRPSTGDFSENSADFPASPDDFSESPADLSAAIGQLARVFQERHHVPNADRDSAIVAMCSVCSLSLAELAHLLNRAPAYVRTIVRSLIHRGLLAYVHPEAPSHPRQRYIAGPAVDPDNGDVRANRIDQSMR